MTIKYRIKFYDKTFGTEEEPGGLFDDTGTAMLKCHKYIQEEFLNKRRELEAQIFEVVDGIENEQPVFLSKTEVHVWFPFGPAYEDHHAPCN